MICQGEIVLTLDRRKITDMDFPLALEADGNRWIYPLLIIAGAAFWFGGAVAGGAAAIGGAAVYGTLGRADVARRLDRRIRDRGLRSLESWRKLWRFGAIILTTRDGRVCQGPGGNWMALARDSVARDGAPGRDRDVALNNAAAPDDLADDLEFSHEIGG